MAVLKSLSGLSWMVIGMIICIWVVVCSVLRLTILAKMVWLIRIHLLMLLKRGVAVNVPTMTVLSVVVQMSELCSRGFHVLYSLGVGDGFFSLSILIT